jgi:hypothetical protein
MDHLHWRNLLAKLLSTWHEHYRLTCTCLNGNSDSNGNYRCYMVMAWSRKWRQFYSWSLVHLPFHHLPFTVTNESPTVITDGGKW